MLFQKIKKSIVILMTGTLLISFAGISAMAAAPKSSTTPDAVSQATANAKGPVLDSKTIKTKLDALVKSKTITSAQEAKVIAAYTKMAASRPSKPTNQNDGQKQTPQADGTQPADNQNGNPPKMDGNRNRLDPLSDLVKAKTITQKQADAINKALAAIKPAAKK